jgi:hypothetical protein
MKVLVQRINKLSRNLALISIPAALLLGADPAKAIRSVNIFDDGSDLEVVASGGLSGLGAPCWAKSIVSAATDSCFHQT